MSIAAFFRQRRLPALVLFLASAAAQAQIPPAPPSSDPAVRLAANMRDLARNPNSIVALKGAGESALAVGDIDAAFNFLSRAQELSPTDGRIKALLGSALIQMERPSDALQLFAEAETLGVEERLILKDRGLAYDLRGDQKRAQRDYQQFLRSNQDDEVTRRLALSYGISGERERALQLLDPLLKQRDQSAWRARTFILAMNGAMREADDIAAQVMPSDAGASMRPFLRQLAMLSPSQRALAVNFGIMPADGGRGAATYAQSSPEPVTSGGQLKEPEGKLVRKGRSSRASRGDEEESPSWAASSRDRKRNREVAMANLPAPRVPDADGPRPDFRIDSQPVLPPPVVTPAPSRPLVRAPLPSAPAAPAPAPRVATVNLPPVRTVTPAAPLPQTPPASGSAPMGARVGARIGPVDAARVPEDIRPMLPSAAPAVKPGVAVVAAPPQTTLKGVPTVLTRLPPPDTAAPVATPAVSSSGALPAPVASNPVTVATAVLPPPVAAEPAAPPPPPTEVALAPSVAPSAPSPVFEVPLPSEKPAMAAVSAPGASPILGGAPAVVAETVAPQSAPSAPATISASLVPTVAPVASEAERVPAPPVVPVESKVAPTPGFGSEPSTEPAPAQTMIAMASPPSIPPGQPRPDTPAEPAAAVTPPDVPAPDAPAAPADVGLSSIIAGLTPEAESTAGPLPSDRELRAIRLAAKKKADAEAAAKTEAETKKVAAEKEKALEAAKAKANPARIWVQIATGSNKAGLGTTVRSVREKAPKAIGGLTGWYAPVRATHRILVGPMKSAADARALVTALAKEGVQANSWSSAAGEEVFRIGK